MSTIDYGTINIFGMLATIEANLSGEYIIHILLKAFITSPISSQSVTSLKEMY